MVRKAKSDIWSIWGTIITALVLWVWFAISTGSFHKVITAPNIFIHTFLWFLIGIFLRLLQDGKLNNVWADVLVLLIGSFLLGLLWHLPIWFPSLKLNDYGFELNLKNSPLVFLISMAFLLGYYRRVALNIPIVLWKQFKKKFGIKEDEDQKGFAKYRLDTFLRGLEQILGFDNPKKD